MSSEAERRRYAEKIAREWAEKGKLVEGGWRAFRATLLRDMDFDEPVNREDALRTLYYLACDHLFCAIVGPMLDPDAEITDGELRRMELLQAELQQFRLRFTAPHSAGRG